MQLFYSPEIGDENNFLPEDESTHCVKVLRLKEKSKIQIIDGKGHFYTAEITVAHPKKCEFKILTVSEDSNKRDFYLHIAIAPTKNSDRTEWFIEKAVEIGIDEITFIKCEHSERKQLNMERIERIAISAMKQSLKAYLPKINPVTDFKNFISNTNKEVHYFVAHLESGEKKHLKEAMERKGKSCILIGPEGDFSPSEIEIALKNNFSPVTLGPSRLRTETAGIIACHTINLINQ
jgi:16S rRNA (uracil1498-N3)-methyltransferase